MSKSLEDEANSLYISLGLRMARHITYSIRNRTDKAAYLSWQHRQRSISQQKEGGGGRLSGLTSALGSDAQFCLLEDEEPFFRFPT